MVTFWRRSRPALAVLLLSAALSVVSAAPASAAPARPDLSVDLIVAPTAVPVNGETVDADVYVSNNGTAVAAGVSVVLNLPTGAYIGGEGPGSDSPWQCTLSPAVSCAHPTLGAGESAAPLRLPVELPSGVDGESVEIAAAVATTSRETATKNNVDRQSISYDASIVYPDLYFSEPVVGLQYVIEGDWVRYFFRIGNRGNIPADDVRVRVTGPATMDSWHVHDRTDPAWQCTQVASPSEWECVHGPLPVGVQTPVLDFVGLIPAGEPGDLLPVTATVSTSTPGEKPEGNTHNGGFVYDTPSYVRGQVWLDADQDGQRSGEEGATTPEQLSISVVPTDGGLARSVDVNPDGSFRLPVHQGRYHLEVGLSSATLRFTLSNVGDDATDSDVYVTYDTTDYQSGQTDPVDVPYAGEGVLDIGLISLN
jgi:hypothetical protein